MRTHALNPSGTGAVPDPCPSQAGALSGCDTCNQRLAGRIWREGTLGRVAPEPAYILERIVECLGEQGELPGQGRRAHQPVVGVDRYAETQSIETVDRMLLDRGHCAGLHIGRRAHLERNLLIEYVRGKVTERLTAALTGLNVFNDRNAV